MIAISTDSMHNPGGCSWRKLLAWSHCVLGFLALWYCKLVYWDAAEACYITPCYEGPGLEELWKVNKGVTFTGESAGLFALAHAALGCLLFVKRSSESSSLLEDAHFLVGVFGGATLCASLLSLNMVYVWGAETNLLINLSKLRDSNKVFDESGRHMVVNHSLTKTFLKLSSVSLCLCFFQLMVLFQLLVSRMEFTKHFRLLARRGVEGNEAMSMTQNGTSSSNINSSETMPLMV
jgi:hypothetical protein